MRAACAAALGALVFMAWAPSAAAHANLRASDPAAGTTLRVAPAAVTLTFTEPPEVSLAQIHVLDRRGNAVQRGPARAVADEANTLRVEVRSLDRGVYAVTWRVVSKADGHATAGAFAFGVGTSPGPVTDVPQPKTPGPAPVEIAGRWLFIVGLVIVLGGALMAAVAFDDKRGPMRIYLLSGAVAALVGVVLLAVAQRNASGAGFGAFFATTIGRAVVWRAVVVAGALLASALSVRAGRAAFAAAAVLAAAAMLVEAAAGHAAAVASYTWLAIAAQWVHFAAAGVWIGGLGAVVAVVAGVRGEPSDTKALAIARFSTMAAASLAVIAGTGTFRAVVQVRRWNALTSSGYGRVVLAKVGLIAVLALLGARNRYVNLPAARNNLRGFRRVSRAELGIGAIVLVAAALLAALSPPPPGAVAEAAAPLVASGSDLGRTVRVRLTIAPGHPGSNEFRVRVTEYDIRDPFGATRVSLRFEFDDARSVGPSTLALRRTGDDWRARGTNLSIGGRWRVTVVVQGRTTSAEVPLDVATRCPTEVLSPGPPTIFTQQLEDSATAQTYLDPGKAGYNEVHFTFFDANGAELAVPRDPAITAWRPGTSPLTLEVRRFSSGHFIGSGRFTAARWRFESTATPQGSREALRACFEQTIR